MPQRASKSPKVRIAAAFIEWVLGAAAIGAVFIFVYGWSEGGAPMFFGALFAGVLLFLAHAAVILYSEA